MSPSSPTSSAQEALNSCACHKARMAARAVTRAYDEALRPAELRITQFLVLVAVDDGAMSIAALAKSLGMDRSTLTRNLAPLEKDGLVTLGAEARYRSRTVASTAKGKARLNKARPLWESAQAALQAKLGRNWAAVHDGLDYLIHAA